MTELDRIIAVIPGGERFLLSSHINPDGDAVGSQLALYHLLRSLGKSVQVINRDPVPSSLSFLPGSAAIRPPKNLRLPYDCTFMLDCGQPNRNGSVVPDSQAGYGTVINIDHHITAVPWADINWLDHHASSTSEMIHRLVVALIGRPDLDMACCIYTGLVTDTGSFRYSNTNSRVLTLAASLVEMGVDPARIASHLYDSVPYRTLKLLSRALQSLGMTDDGLVAWLAVTGDDLKETGTTWEATEEFVNYPRSIPSVAAAVFFKEIAGNEIKVSLRSRGRIDMASLALRHGGGGHVNAAGFTAQGSLEEVKLMVLSEVREMLRHQQEEPSRGES